MCYYGHKARKNFTQNCFYNDTHHRLTHRFIAHPLISFLPKSGFFFPLTFKVTSLESHNVTGNGTALGKISEYAECEQLRKS